jgi:hypothetical protein
MHIRARETVLLQKVHLAGGGGGDCCTLVARAKIILILPIKIRLLEAKTPEMISVHFLYNYFPF